MTAVPGDGNRLHSNALRVLLVEDNLINRKLATRILEKLGCLVDAAANGAEGVAMAPGAYEALFVGLGHTDEVLQRIGDAAHRAATVARAELATLEP